MDKYVTTESAGWLVELAFYRLTELGLKPKRILDLCCGDGHMGKLLANLYPDAEIIGTDIRGSEESYKPLDYFVQGDLFQNVTGKFDLIVSNPPYLPSKVVENHPWRVCLDGGETGLELLERISKEMKPYLARGALVVLEVPDEKALPDWERVKFNGAYFAIKRGD